LKDYPPGVAIARAFQIIPEICLFASAQQFSIRTPPERKCKVRSFFCTWKSPRTLPTMNRDAQFLLRKPLRMNVAVITPVFQTPRSWLDECLASVACQTFSCTHFVVSDGDAILNDAILPGVEFLRLPRPHQDCGNIARAIGSVSAIGRGFDAIAYLDADNWYEKEHLQLLVELQQRTGAAVCSCGRNLIDLEGSLLGQCREVDGEKFVDTSCLLLTRAAFGIVQVWYQMPREVVAICDRVVWKAIKDAGLSRAHLAQPTVNFRTRYRGHYEYFGKAVPVGAKHVHIEATPSGQFLSATVSVSETVVPASRDRTTQPYTARVSLCMIVKNEERHLADCLAPLANLFTEIIVVDTGSTDRTKEIAARYGAKVYDFTWVDSFAAARNESIRHATGEWIFWLDADDRLDEENLKRLTRFLHELPDENNAYMMCQWSTPDPSTGSALIVDQVRLFRNLPKARWRYRVHEQIYLALRENGANEVGTDIVIRHLGYQETDLRLRKQDRNIRLLQMELEAMPRDSFVLFNLANAYMDHGQADKAIPFLLRCIECAPARVSFLSKAYFLLAGALNLLGRGDEALQHCREGKKLFPQSADLLFQEGVLLIARGAWADVRDSFERILELPPKRNYVGTDANMTGYRTRHNLALAYRNLGLSNKAEEQWLLLLEQTPEFGPAWLALVELYLEQNRQDKTDALLQRLDDKSYRATILPALQARLTLARSDLPGACRILEEGIMHSPGAMWLRLFLADMLLRVAKDEIGAEKHLRAVLALSPNDAQARLKLAQLLVARRG
jgi:glycosyltransferase involved in cell wall biosynthesis